VKKWLVFIVMLVVLAGCGAGTDYKPVAIQEGVDHCAECNMMIADDQHAVQILLKDGKSLKFDDIGDLFVHKTKHQLENQIGAQFVRDYHTLEWLKLEDAFYAYDESFRSPMAFGVYSFKTKADAEKFIQEQGKGKLMTSAELANHTWESHMDHSGGMSGHGAAQGHGEAQGHGGAKEHMAK
jgi:copper chaperone NosL